MEDTTVPKTALILFAHGARDPEWAEPMHRVANLVRQSSPALRVEVAFFEFMRPGLRECVEALLPEGYRRILVLPMFIARGGHLKRDVPLMIEDLRERHPQADVELASAVGEAENVVRAMAEHALGLTRR